MKFNTIIIGGGLSGLICGIKLLQNGQKCAIISSGQSAIHFSSGSFDLLNYLPNGEKVENPLVSVEKLINTSPKHPYSKIGSQQFSVLANEAESFFEKIQLPVQGKSEKNHFRITPMGTLMPTWLTLSDYVTSNSENTLPWKNVAIYYIPGFLDFYPQFIADEFAKLGTNTTINTFNIPDLDILRKNPSEMRSVNIARILDKQENINRLIHILKENSSDAEAIILPAFLGLQDKDLLQNIQHEVSKPVLLIPTLPPSIIGIRTQEYLKKYFLEMGGTFMLGDSINCGEIENDKLKQVYSFNHGDIPFTGENFVLATGSYFSQGLIATQNHIKEPIFDLDVDYLNEREKWYDPSLFNQQNYQKFGVKTDGNFKALYHGQPIKNLYVAGAILEGFNPIHEGCGAGVSILSALYVADKILHKEEEL